MKNINVRLEDELHAQLKEAAGEDSRSLNGEIITLLKSGLHLREMKVADAIFRSGKS
jgi:hypothetical protein